MSWVGLLLAGVLLLSGCNPANRRIAPTPPPPTATPAPPQTIREAPSPTPAIAPVTATPRAASPAAAQPAPRPTALPGEYLYVRSGFGGAASQGIMILDATTGARQGDLPPGVAAPDWSVLYAVDDQDGVTTVKALDPAAGSDAPPIRRRLIPGDYQPVLSGFDGAFPGASSGLSPNGKWLVLSGPSAAAEQNQGAFARNGGASDRFVVVDTAFTGYARGVILPRPYRFYAIGDDGNFLYLLENASQDQGRFRWQIRVYDLKKSQFDDKPLSDSTGETVLTQGTAAVPSPDGSWLYSVDISPSGGQVLHALNLMTQTVQRVDVPSSLGGPSPFQIRSSLLLPPDGRSLYIVNSTPAAVVAVDTTQLTVRASVNISLTGSNASPSGVSSRGLGTAAGAATPPVEGRPGSPQGRGVESSGNPASGRRFGLRNPVLSPDGRRLYVPQNDGLAVLNTNDLSISAFYLPGTPVDALALTADGKRLYAMSGELGKIIRLDAQTGDTLAQLDAPGPSLAFLHVSTNP